MQAFSTAMAIQGLNATECGCLFVLSFWTIYHSESLVD